MPRHCVSSLIFVFIFFVLALSSSTPSTKTDLLVTLSSLKSNAPGAMASGDIEHLFKLGAVYVELNLLNHASFVYTGMFNLLEERPDLDPDSVHVARLSDIMDAIYRKRAEASVIYATFKHSDKKGKSSEVPLAIPYYVCLEYSKNTPMIGDFSCKETHPSAVIVTVDNLTDHEFLNNVVAAICSESLGFELSTESEYEKCRHHTTQSLANEIFSVNRENGSGGFNAAWWRRGAFPLDLEYKETMDALDDVVARISESAGLEGNLWHTNGWKKEMGSRVIDADGTKFDDEVKLSRKRRILLTLLSSTLDKGEGKYFEIGFNAGHSSAMVLEMFPRVNITSFDVCAHQYTDPAFEHLKKIFPNRIELVCGSSEFTVPEYGQKALEEGRYDVQQDYDLLFIDAGHLYCFAYSDIINAAPFAKPGAIVVVDDCFTDLYNRADGSILAEHDIYEFHVSMAWRHAVAMGIVEPLAGDINGDASLCIGRYRKHQVEKYRAGFPLSEIDAYVH